MGRPKAIVPVANDENFIKMIVYGEPGVGKSQLVGTTPGKVLVLTHNPAELASAALNGTKADRWHIASWKDADEAWQYLRMEGERDYEWVWLDNGTLFQEQIMDEVMEDLVKEKPHRSRFIPDKPEYLNVQSHLSLYIRQLVSLEMHVGVTAHVMRFEDEEGNVTFQPSFQGGQGQLSQKICGYMGTVAYMHSAARRDKEDNSKVIRERKLLLDKRAKFLAKDRFSAFPSGELTNPTMPKYIEAALKRVPTLGQSRKPPAKAAATKKAAPAKKSAGSVKKTSTRRTA